VLLLQEDYLLAVVLPVVLAQDLLKVFLLSLIVLKVQRQTLQQNWRLLEPLVALEN
jgi:hypothetical protein